MRESEKLLLEIARCDGFVNFENTACERINCFQKGENRQLPEPWSGDLEHAPILFISSNPSISEQEYFPLLSWEDESIIDFFHNRFSASKGYVKNYRYPKLKDGSYAKNWVRYWSYLRTIASDLLLKERDAVIPGIDYVMTEVVRCKSSEEYGVNEALDVCATKFLNKTLQASNAKVIIAVGSKAKSMLQDKLLIQFENRKCITHTIGGLERCIFATPHSNSRQKKKLEYILDDDIIRLIQEKLKI
ncbi:MAG: uracil-DNA glycosylase family protein [Bacteroidales bacterium]